MISNKFFLLLLNILLGFITQGKSQSLLWKIEGADLKAPSFIYGTMHTSRDEVFEFMDSVLIDFDKTEAFVMEINPDSVNKGALQKMIMLQGDTSLKKLLSEKEYKLLAKRFRKKTGYPLMLFNKIKPLYILLMMQEGKQDKGKPLDLFFNDLAKKQRKVVFGLERVEDQMALLDGINTESQFIMLKKYIQNPDEENGMDEKLLDSYVKGDLNSLLEITESDTSMGPDFSKNFIENRNLVMVKGIISIIPRYPAFIAIGAAHLPGEKGVLSLLRKQGYRVTPVISNKRENPKEVKKR